jgi:hypothetical protein
MKPRVFGMILMHDGRVLSDYFFTFAHRFFCAAEILARAAADIVRLPTAFGAALPVKAEIAASTPASFRTRVARSWWSMLNKSVISLL